MHYYYVACEMTLSVINWTRKTDAFFSFEEGRWEKYARMIIA